jgi:hypothetical protein
MFRRMLVFLGVLGAVTALIVLSSLYSNDATRRDSVLVVEPSELVLNDLVVGQEFDANICVFNRTERTHRIVGIPEKV